VAFAADGQRRHTHLFGRDLIYSRYVPEQAELHAALRRQRTEAWMGRDGEAPPRDGLDLARLMRLLVGADGL
jgi:hypothetical protein